MSKAWDLIHGYEERRRVITVDSDGVAVQSISPFGAGVASEIGYERNPFADMISVEPAGHHAYVDEDVPVPAEMVTIPRSEYEDLLEDSKILEDLYARGVDNWEGF